MPSRILVYFLTSLVVFSLPSAPYLVWQCPRSLLLSLPPASNINYSTFFGIVKSHYCWEMIVFFLLERELTVSSHLKKSFLFLIYCFFCLLFITMTMFPSVNHSLILLLKS